MVVPGDEEDAEPEEGEGALDGDPWRAAGLAVWPMSAMGVSATASSSTSVAQTFLFIAANVAQCKAQIPSGLHGR